MGRFLDLQRRPCVDHPRSAADAGLNQKVAPWCGRPLACARLDSPGRRRKVPSETMSDNVIPFRPKPADPRVQRRDALSKIIQWSGEMLKAGHMPHEVRTAFATFFGKDESGPAPRPPCG